MEQVKMTYMGEQPTRVATERGGEKIDVKHGQTVEMNKDVAVSISKTYKNVWVPEGGQILGGLDEDKVETAVPKKAKK